MGFCNNEFILISVSYSYYEVYTNSQRAFSGLGFTYGSDEDAAFIITWLELCGLGGIKLLNSKVNFNNETQNYTKFNIFLKTLGFTYLNPHVYSDTVFFLGNFSKNFVLYQKILFGAGASIASFIFFFAIGYLSKNLSKYAKSEKVWKVINIFIVSFMAILTLFIISEMIR